MRLVVVGCAGSFPAPEAACSAYLVQASDDEGRLWTLLLDLGNGAVGPLQRYGSIAEIDAIGLSHLHADHIADLPALSVARRYRPSGALPPVPVWGPAGLIVRLVELAGDDEPEARLDTQFQIHVWHPGQPVTVGPLCVTPVAMNHSVPCCGVRVTGPAEGDRSRTVTIGYTGDTDSGPGLTAVAQDVDLLLAEAAFQEGRDDAIRGIHLTARRAAQAAASGGARHLVLTHLPAWNDPEAAEAEARSVYAGLVTMAVPGARFVL